MLRAAKGSPKFDRKFNEIYWTSQQRNLGAIDSLDTTPGTTPCMAPGATSADDHDPADSGEPLGNDAATSDFQHPTDSAEELLGKGSTSTRQSEDWT